MVRVTQQYQRLPLPVNVCTSARPDMLLFTWWPGGWQTSFLSGSSPHKLRSSVWKQDILIPPSIPLKSTHFVGASFYHAAKDLALKCTFFSVFEEVGIW